MLHFDPTMAKTDSEKSCKKYTPNSSEKHNRIGQSAVSNGVARMTSGSVVLAALDVFLNPDEPFRQLTDVALCVISDEVLPVRAQAPQASRIILGDKHPSWDVWARSDLHLLDHSVRHLRCHLAEHLRRDIDDNLLHGHDNLTRHAIATREEGLAFQRQCEHELHCRVGIASREDTCHLSVG